MVKFKLLDVHRPVIGTMLSNSSRHYSCTFVLDPYLFNFTDFCLFVNGATLVHYFHLLKLLYFGLYLTLFL